MSCNTCRCFTGSQPAPAPDIEEDVVGERMNILIQRKGAVLIGRWIEELENFARWRCQTGDPRSCSRTH